MPCDVREFYKGKNVMLTGGTGFFGKMITEKLLRCCDVNGIYFIVRTKKGLCPNQRIVNLLDEPVFENMLANDPKCRNKVHIIEGDLSKKGLGLNQQDKDFIKDNINIVFHCGASLNMDSKLSDAVITNVRGTFEILDMLKDASHLNAFILVSTAYSHCYKRKIDEIFYETPIDPLLLIKMVEELPDGILDDISKGLIGKWPNSYVYSKAVAENLLLSKTSNIPAGLFRPTIVTSTVCEPVPGWSDNLYGPLGILLSSHCGILRVIRANGRVKQHTVPGDMCINALLSFAWDVNNKWRNVTNKYQPPVVNFSAKNTKLLLSIDKYISTANLDYPPFKRAMWYQMLILVELEQTYIFLKFLLHTIPSYLIDSLMVIFNKKPIMGKVYKKLHRISDVLSYFLVNEWDINNENLMQLWEKLSEQDKAMFNFNINSMDLKSYFENLLTGLKKFILKEDMSKVENHKSRYKRLTMLHFTLKYTLMGFVTYNIYKCFTNVIKKKRY